MTTDAADSTPHVHDIAVSFAGEDRTYVEEVVRRLKDEGVDVFYDEDYAAETWGTNLIEFFTELYQHRTRFVVLFVSTHYAKKSWSVLERQSALAAAMTKSEAYALPARLDDTVLPGLLPTVGYLDLRRVGMEGLVVAILAKIGTRGTRPASSSPDETFVPTTEKGIQYLIGERPDGWEYALYCGYLQLGLENIQEKYRDFEIGFARRNGRRLSVQDAPGFLSGQLDHIFGILDSFKKVLAPEAMETAIGAPGEAGDPERIAHLASRYLAVFEEFVDWASELRGISANNDVTREALEKLAVLVASPLATMYRFIREYVIEIDALPQRLADEEEIEITMTVNLDMDQEKLDDFLGVLPRLKLELEAQ